MESLQDNRIYFGADGNSVPCIKRFLTELKYEGMAPTSIMFYKDVGHSQEGAKEVTALLEAGAFDGPKPVRLLNRLLTLANTDKDNGDIILDFFSGSATTAHAVMQLNVEDGGNRRFIMVQLPEVCGEKSEAFKAGYKNICEIGKERIRRAGMKLMEQVTSGAGNLKGEGWGCGMPSSENEWEYAIKNILDVGFKVFKLDSSNLKLWDDTPVVEDDIEALLSRMEGHIDGLKPDRSDEDLIYEILLKTGYPLTSSIEALDVNGATVYSVDNHDMLICLQENITTEHIESMASLAPKKLVVAERTLADNSAMSNAYYLLENRGIELKIV